MVVSTGCVGSIGEEDGIEENERMDFSRTCGSHVILRPLLVYVFLGGRRPCTVKMVFDLSQTDFAWYQFVQGSLIMFRTGSLLLLQPERTARPASL